jgi:hypothetical protein
MRPQYDIPVQEAENSVERQLTTSEPRTAVLNLIRAQNGKRKSMVWQRRRDDFFSFRVYMKN